MNIFCISHNSHVWNSKFYLFITSTYLCMSVINKMYAHSSLCLHNIIQKAMHLTWASVHLQLTYCRLHLHQSSSWNETLVHACQSVLNGSISPDMSNAFTFVGIMTVMFNLGIWSIKHNDETWVQFPPSNLLGCSNPGILWESTSCASTATMKVTNNMGE